MIYDEGQTNIHTEGDGAYERAKRMLEAANIDPEDVEEIQVMVAHGGDDEESSQGIEVSEAEEDEEESATPDLAGIAKQDMTVSEEFGRKHTKYRGQRTHQAIGGILESDDEWVDGHDVVDLFGLDPDQGKEGTGKLIQSAFSKVYHNGVDLNGTHYEQPVERQMKGNRYVYRLKESAKEDAIAEVQDTAF